MLVQRLSEYGFEVSPAELARAAGYQRVAPFLPQAALSDLTGLSLGGGTSGCVAAGIPDAVLVGDLGEIWSYALLQEAFEYLMAGAALIALSRDRYWMREGRLTLDAGPFVAGLEFAVGRRAIVAGKPCPAFYEAALSSLGLVGCGRRATSWAAGVARSHREVSRIGSR